MPEMCIPAESHFVIWCDGIGAVIQGEIHANFKLNASGEEIGLYYKGQCVDAITFDDRLKNDMSYGRISDGADTWAEFQKSSIGERNIISEQL